MLRSGRPPPSNTISGRSPRSRLDVTALQAELMTGWTHAALEATPTKFKHLRASIDDLYRRAAGIITETIVERDNP